MPRIDPTARIHPRAELAEDVVVGPYCVVGEHVRIGAGTVLDAHVVVAGHTELGCHNHLHPFASIGTPPQDHSYRNEPTRLLVGDHNEFREGVTVNTGTVKGGGITVLGNHNLLMSCSHVGHDCILTDHVTMANCCLLAGHVKIEQGVILSGHIGIHQFVTLGEVCMIGALTGITHDVPPFMMMLTDHRTPRGVNIIGMRRNGYSDDDIRAVQHAYRLVYRSSMNATQAAAELAKEITITPAVQKFLDAVTRAEVGKLGRFLETTRVQRRECA